MHPRGKPRQAVPTLKNVISNSIRAFLMARTLVLLKASTAFSQQSEMRQAAAQSHLIDKGLRHHGMDGDYSVPFLRRKLVTPWLPMLRVQLRAMFVEHDYLFPTSDASHSAWRGTVIDCGSNLGLFSIWAWLALKPGQIVAIEADPTLVSRYTYPNISSYVPQNRFQVIGAAVGLQNGVTQFAQTGKDDGAVLQEWEPTINSKVMKAVEVPQISLDTILEGQQLVSLLKIDIEGTEWDVILSCSGLHKVRRIHIEHAIRSGKSFTPLAQGIEKLQSEGFALSFRLDPATREDDIIGFLIVKGEKSTY